MVVTKGQMTEFAFTRQEIRRASAIAEMTSVGLSKDQQVRSAPSLPLLGIKEYERT